MSETIDRRRWPSRILASGPAGGRAGWRPLAASGLGAGQLLALAAQLALLLLAAAQFRVEEVYGFTRILPVLFVGFLVHALLPLRLRLPFFLLLSLVSVAVVFRAPQVVALVGLGLALVGICHLPVAYGARVALLVAAAALLAAVRAEWIYSPMRSLPRVVLPILGSMFMFRLVVYMYDLRHEKKPASVWERLAYFFMVPNICFPLFPVVDFQTFRRTHYDAGAAAIYQKGLLWIFRGLSHLLLYRLVYHALVLSPTEVEGPGGVAQFMVATYLLYLRISGQFHLIVGILCLFGFNLPETHHRYFLASGFNDFWRRINIYWKDFMMKVFYYPVLMRSRAWGMTTAMLLATGVVFVSTWLLHSYQWFWLQGSFPVTGPDAAFWGVLGAAVMVNSVWEAKRGRRRALGKAAWTLRGAVGRSAKTVGFFLLMSALWSLWSSPSLGEWAALVSRAGAGGAAEAWLVAGAVVALVGVGVVGQYVTSKGWGLSVVGEGPSSGRAAAYTAAGAALFLVVGTSGVYERFGGRASELAAAIQTNQLNQRDEGLLDRGYYEGLLDNQRFTSALASVQANDPDALGFLNNPKLTRKTGDVLYVELVPSYEGTLQNALFQTNRWGMRDKDYEMERPPGIFRIALLGASYEMGTGVAQEETFEWVLEDQFNRENAGGPYDRLEILNFAVGSYSTLQNALVAERKVPAFKPDVVMFAIHATEDSRLLDHLSRVVQAGSQIEDPYLESVIQKCGIKLGMDEGEAEKLLMPAADEIVRWSFQRIVEACRAHGIVPVCVYVPTTKEVVELDERYGQLASLAREAGFITWSLEGAYGDTDPRLIRVSRWDTHPNAKGHRMLADRLYELIRENAQVIRLERPEPATRVAAPRPGDVN